MHRAAPDRIVVTNDDGEWTVYARCRSTGETTVGPGYVARLVTPDGHTIVDDVRPAGTVNDPAYGGLGTFAWHHARGRPGSMRFALTNAWEVSGRACADATGGFGVVRSRVVERRREQRDETGEPFTGFAIDVFLTDAATNPQPIVRVRYRYRVYASVVKSWISIRELCGDGHCGRTDELAFVKEPKLVAHVRWPFARVATFDDEGILRCVYTSGGGPTGPILETGQ